MRRAATILLVATLGLAGGAPIFGQSHSISGSGHDLSVNGPGPVTASTQAAICLFCHASHRAEPAVPLWNHQLSASDYTPLYGSSTYLQTNPQSISQRSKLCLSCHDGTVAIGQTVANDLIATSGSMRPADIIGNGGLNADHPFGFVLPAIDDGEIKPSLITSPPATGDTAVKLYNNSIECVTCHEPHDPGRDTAVQFMVRDNTNGAICLACHDVSRGVLTGWNSGAHKTATNTVAFASGLPYTDPSSVATNACASCHLGHNAAGTGARLLRGAEEAACATCHGSTANVTPGLPNIITELSKQYAHPVLASPSPPHDPAEAIPIMAPASSRHSECADCHNPHVAQATSGTPTPPGVQASLSGTWGVSATDGTTRTVPPLVNQYEICFKCHANSNNKPQNAAYVISGRTPYRASYDSLAASDRYNVRLALQSTVARHNVTQPSRAAVAPSLRQAMLNLSGQENGRSLQDTSFYLYCTDCHNNNAARISGGAGPNGPHGSDYYHLLERRYEYDAVPATPGDSTTGPTYSSGVTGPYAICDKCHDLENSLLNTSADPVFRKHYRHVVQVGTSCSTCHAAHGIQGGAAANNAHLVNFDTAIVGPDNQGRLYLDTGARTCYLRCHGVLHNPKNY